ncbi:MAG: hypothetical protein LBJ59_12015 [Zoogloeaceae bacterium]|jgi:hypothetical protein|nr:hypothetical protein [Zoogloeaceae bacterium]
MSARKCRICGCTDDDCRQCVDKTGAPCYWIEEDVCSACAPKAAIGHVIRRMICDPRLAWLIGPGSRTWELVTAAFAVINDMDIDKFRREIEAQLKYEEWPNDRS